MPRFRILHVEKVEDIYQVVSLVARIVEADSKQEAIHKYSQITGTSFHGVKIERLLLTPEDIKPFLNRTTRPIRIL